MTDGDTRTSAAVRRLCWRIEAAARGLRVGSCAGILVPAADEPIRRSMKRSAGGFGAEQGGVEAAEISVPWHIDGPSCRSGVILEGAPDYVKGYGVGKQCAGLLRVDAGGAGARMRKRDQRCLADVKLPDECLGEILHRNYHGAIIPRRRTARAAAPRALTRRWRSNSAV